MGNLTAYIITGGILGGTALLIACMIAGCEFFFRLGKADMNREILEERSRTSPEASRIERQEFQEEIRAC